MAFSICIGRIIPKGKQSNPGSRKTPWRIGADLRHVESSVRCHRKDKNGGI